MVALVTAFVINMWLALVIIPAMKKGLLAPVTQPVMVILVVRVIIFAMAKGVLATVLAIGINVFASIHAIANHMGVTVSQPAMRILVIVTG